MCSSVNLKSHLAIPFNQSYMRSHLATSFNHNKRMCKKWSHCNGWPTQVEKKCENGLIMMGDLPRWKKYEVRSHCNGDLPRWKKCEVRSHCNGWPTKVEKIWRAVSLWWVTYPDGKNVKCGLIVMGDLPKKGGKSGLIVMGDLPKWKNGLIVMGDLPK